MPSSASGTRSPKRRLTTWHYHWLIVHEFLPLFVGQELVDRMLRRGRRFYRPAPGAAVISVEFQVPRTASAARRLPLAEAVRRLADLLRLRGRERQAEQEDRHQALDAAVHLPLGAIASYDGPTSLPQRTLLRDPGSYLTAQPGWTPTLGGRGANFRMTDFLAFAGVDPASRRQ